MAGRPLGAQNKDKPFREALRLELVAAAGKRHSLRHLAAKLIRRAGQGDVQAIREIADRIDGKVPQGIGQAPELDKLEITWSKKSKSTMSQDSNSSPSITEPNDLLASLPTDGQVKQ